MPETSKPALDPAATAAHNDAIIRQQAAQDAAGHSTVLTDADLKSTSDAMDRLAEAQAKSKEDAAVAAQKTSEEIAAAAQAAKEAAGKTPEEIAAAAEAAKKSADDAAAARTAELEKAETFFKDSPKLPPNASPKSGEAFNSIKIKAAQEISARDQQLETLRKEKTALEELLKNPVPPELEKEISELREWRAKLDVEADPKFKEFDKAINGTRDFIYAQLQANPNVNESLIEQIKKFGGPDMIKWDKIFAGLNDPTLQRIIESKIADIEMAKFNKTQAINTAKTNIKQYVGERTKQFEQTSKAHTEATQKHLSEFVGKFDWMKEQKIDAGLDVDKRKIAEEHNAFVSQLQQELLGALNDDSPEMRAIQIAGMAQLVNLDRVHKSTVAELATAQKALKEANDTIAKFKAGSTSRLRESGAASAAAQPVKPDEGKLFNTPAIQALDDLATQMMETRARAAAGA